MVTSAGWEAGEEKEEEEEVMAVQRSSEVAAKRPLISVSLAGW